MCFLIRIFPVAPRRVFRRMTVWVSNPTATIQTLVRDQHMLVKRHQYVIFSRNTVFRQLKRAIIHFTAKFYVMPAFEISISLLPGCPRDKTSGLECRPVAVRQP